MKEYPRIAIVYLLYYHNESYIDSVVSSLKKISYPKEKVEFVVVSNPHDTDGSFVHYIEDTVMPLSGNEIPHTTLIANTTNIGFADGNNKGAEWAVEHGFDYVFFHNNDGFFASNALEPLAEAMEADKTIGSAQSLMLLYPETDLVNSAGNAFHYLGFGFCNEYKTPFKNLQLPAIKDIDYPSGAALLVRTDLIKKFGAWSDGFFMYHEDLEWGMRLRMAGYRSVLVRDSIFYHQYQFSRSISKFYYMERNRHAVMLMFFRIPTLVLLLPIAIPLELGLWFFSWKNGYADKRWEVYKYWMKKENWHFWLEKRKKIQSIRVIGDRELLEHSSTGIFFQDSSVDTPLVKNLANPIMKWYYKIIVRGLIWW